MIVRKLGHEYFMRKALVEALKAKGCTWPNPLVGAVIVKNKRIIACGYHKMAGRPHAEAEALKEAGHKAKGADLYVTLEPCSFFGRTPPCTTAIKSAGVRRVFVGMLDPNPKYNGRGIKILRRSGLKIETGFLQNELKKINEPYLKYITKKIPFITIKVGQSLDGKIATKSGDSQWITSCESRMAARCLRQDSDAIMVGINTLIKDNPRLDPRIKSKRFFKIVVDTNLRIPLDAKILRCNRQSVIVAAKANVGSTKRSRLENLGVKIINTPLKNNGRLDLKFLLRQLAKLEICSVLVEGGGSLIGSLFEQHLVDKVDFFIAPKIIGGRNAISSVMGEGIRRIKDAVELRDVSFKQIGRDFLVEGQVK